MVSCNVWEISQRSVPIVRIDTASIWNHEHLFCDTYHHRRGLLALFCWDKSIRNKQQYTSTQPVIIHCQRQYKVLVD
jgi:hypothetical protein